MVEQVIPQTAPQEQSVTTDSVYEAAEGVFADVGQWSVTHLMAHRFLRNRLAVGALLVLLVMYIVILFAPFFSPYNHLISDEDFVARQPTVPHFVDPEGNFHLRPFVYGTTTSLDLVNLDWVHENDTSQIYPIYFFVHGVPYELFGLIESDLHFYGVDEPGKIFLFGTDRSGRDMVSRIIFGGRVSLTVGLVGVALTIIIGSLLGTISGYFGGVIDTLIQRLTEILMSFPDIALWAALAAALPLGVSSVERFFLITIILSLVGWTGLARQVRAKVMGYREMDYTSAAKAAGASNRRIIMVHMMPNALSHIIVVATLAIPGMILAETALSFLGLGILPPAVSWGSLLQQAQTVSVVVKKPWLLMPGLFVIIAVLAYNFVGDGIRDAADPYSI
jgi:peptide/nickel transport system permease protein